MTDCDARNVENATVGLDSKISHVRNHGDNSQTPLEYSRTIFIVSASDWTRPATERKDGMLSEGARRFTASFDNPADAVCHGGGTVRDRGTKAKPSAVGTR